MTPSANVAAWRTSTEPSWRGIALKALAVSVIALLAAQYLAGYLFLWWFRADPKQATPLTVARYAYYYGDREQVRHRALLASLVGLAAVIACGGILLLPRRRSLHGEARFARRSEISRAGLFAKPATYRAYVRYSNGDGQRQSDAKGDVRGLAVKVVGVPDAAET